MTIRPSAVSRHSSIRWQQHRDCINQRTCALDDCDGGRDDKAGAKARPVRQAAGLLAIHGRVNGYASMALALRACGVDGVSPESRPLGGHGEDAKVRKNEAVTKGAFTKVRKSGTTLLNEIPSIVATVRYDM